MSFQRMSRFMSIPIKDGVALLPSKQSYGIISRRYLYSPEALGVTGYLQVREKLQHQMSNVEDKFKEKMKEYINDPKNMIFTEDLKNILHIARNDDDLDLAVGMMKKFNQQNKQIRFGSYIFGPVVMRLFYVMDKPDLALECFKSPELNGFFDQLLSYQLLLDLLYENQKYQEILDTFVIIQERQLSDLRFPKHVVLLVLAACYKLNTKASWDFATNLWKEATEAGHYPMRKAITFVAALALKQKHPDIALEMLSASKSQTYTTVKNLKVASLTALERYEEALNEVKKVLTNDVAVQTIHTINKDVFENLKSAIIELNDPELTLNLNRLEDILVKQNHLADLSLDALVCANIKALPPRDPRRPHFQNFNRFDNRGGPQRNQFQRPGLKDLV